MEYETFITGVNYLKCSECGNKIKPIGEDENSRYYCYKFPNGVAHYFDTKECIDEFAKRMKLSGKRGEILKSDVVSSEVESYENFYHLLDSIADE